MCETQGCGLDPGNRIAATSRILLRTGNYAGQDCAPFAVFKRDSWGLVATSVVVHRLRHTSRTAPESAKSSRAGPHTDLFSAAVTSVWKAAENRCGETSGTMSPNQTLLVRQHSGCSELFWPAFPLPLGNPGGSCGYRVSSLK